MARAPIGIALSLACVVAPPSRGNGWTPLVHQPPVTTRAGLMLLLTDGRVLLMDGYIVNTTTHWWYLTPDANGSYVNGRWSQAPDANYDRAAFASAVLADGRVLVAGGENSSLGGPESNATEILDPVAETWTVIAPPTGWTQIGDAPGCLLADGRFLLGALFSTDTAIYDPVAGTWSAGPSTLFGKNSEESWALMPDGSVVTCNVYVDFKSQRYVPSLDQWIDCGSTPVDLSGCREIGPEVLMNDGRMFCMGASSHCCLYTSPSSSTAPGTWTQGDDPLHVGRLTLGAQDAPAALLPNGHVLCGLSSITDDCRFHSPTFFFEFDGKSFSRVSDPGNNDDEPAHTNLLLLPSGEVLFSAWKKVYAYTCDGAPDPSWKPAVTSVATDLLPQRDYLLTGTQLNGLSQAVGFGDDAQAATNYPLARLTFPYSGHVFYCRTHDHSSMGVATGATPVSTILEVPSGVERGPALLEVVANGIASDPVPVVVEAPVVIDFDLLAAGVPVTNQYADATFSSDSGFLAWTVATSQGNSLPNAIATGPAAGGVDGTHDLDVDFPRPVVGLAFDAIGVDGAGNVATVNVYERGLFAAALPIDGLGTPAVPVHVDLSVYRDVTRIEIVSVGDAGGIAWDDFVFGIPSGRWENYGAGYPGTLGVPELVAEQDPQLGAAVTLDVGNSPGVATAALLLIGAQPATIPTSKGGELLVTPQLNVPMVVAATGSKLTGGIPNDPSLAGATLYAQALEVDAGAASGLSFSRGLALQIGY
jgi:Kelch motif protein